MVKGDGRLPASAESVPFPLIARVELAFRDGTAGATPFALKPTTAPLSFGLDH
jgi:hypothetical protein